MRMFGIISFVSMPFKFTSSLATSLEGGDMGEDMYNVHVNFDSLRCH